MEQECKRDGDKEERRLRVICINWMVNEFRSNLCIVRIMRRNKQSNMEPIFVMVCAHLKYKQTHTLIDTLYGMTLYLRKYFSSI